MKKREPSCTFGGNADWCSHCGKWYGVPSKIKNGTALWPSDSTSGHISKETRNTNLKGCTHPRVHCSVIYNSQDMEAAQVPISRWVDKTTMGHLHNGILLNRNKEENFTLCDSLDGPGEHYTKWSKPVRERLIPYDMWRDTHHQIWGVLIRSDWSWTLEHSKRLCKQAQSDPSLLCSPNLPTPLSVGI